MRYGKVGEKVIDTDIDIWNCTVINLRLDNGADREFIINSDDEEKLKKILDLYKKSMVLSPDVPNDFDFFELIESMGIPLFVIGEPDLILDL